MTQRFYAVTVKYMYLKPEQLRDHHYEAWVDNAKRKGLIIERVYYEYDEHFRLHMHCVGQYWGTSFRKVSVNLRGYHQHIDDLKTMAALHKWYLYITKEQNADTWSNIAIDHFESKKAQEFNFGDDKSVDEQTEILINRQICEEFVMGELKKGAGVREGQFKG